MVGNTLAFDTADSYLPTMDKKSWMSENRADRNALSNYSIESSDPSIASCSIDENGSEPGIGGRVVLDGKAAGTATVTVRYSFAGVYRTYEDSQIVQVVVSDKENPVASIKASTICL